MSGTIKGIKEANEAGTGYDRRRPIELKGLALAWMSFQTLGIIYSDIGTSPLYVLNGIWSPAGPVPSKEDIIGGISAIIWSLTLLPLIKYVFIALHFGTEEGEGGTFALFHGIFPPKLHNEEEERTLTGDSQLKSAPLSGTSSTLKHFKWLFLFWSLFGTSLTMSDGIFTPAVSVTTAVAGIAVAKPSITNDIRGISIAILAVLFLVQRFGTHRIASSFAPVTFIWLALLFATGIVNITHAPEVFRAFDPSRAVALFIRTKDYDLLAGILLAVTGCEALFANLGQFNRLSIQMSFGAFVYPCLVFAYLGQGARLISDGAAVLPNIFYLTIPGGVNTPLYWILFVFAILASVIASQALITATFSLTQQLINLKSLPPIRMVNTSDTVQGQIYVPAVNYIVGITCIVVVAAFKNSAALTNAYGFAVATVMIVTSTFIGIQIPIVKHKPWILGVAFFIVFCFFDGLFWGAALRKVPQGAWVPLMLGSALTILMIFWTWARGLEDNFDGKNRRNLRNFIVTGEMEEKTRAHSSANIPELPESTVAEVSGGDSDDGALKNDMDLYLLQDYNQKRHLARLPTFAVFHKLTGGKGVPHAFYAFVRQWPALPRVVIFLSVRTRPVARVSVEDRYAVTRVRSLPGFYGLTYSLGFRDNFEVQVNEIVDKITELELRADPVNSAGSNAEILLASKSCTHIVPHYHVVGKRVNYGRFLTPIMQYVRTTLIEEFYRRLNTMFPETANWLTSADEIIHVGVNAEI